MNPGCQVRHGAGQAPARPTPQPAGSNRSAVPESAPPALAHPGEWLPLPPCHDALPPCQGHWCPHWDHRGPQCGPTAACGRTTTALSPVPPAATVSLSPLPQHCPHGPGPMATPAPLRHGTTASCPPLPTPVPQPPCTHSPVLAATLNPLVPYTRLSPCPYLVPVPVLPPRCPAAPSERRSRR